jgi:predicted DsbA family dithiol-disulfide isomerase
MSVQPIDVAVFLVSCAACVYCFILSRRLRRLQNTKDGVGATITALSQSIAAMSATTQDSRTRVGELATRLSQLIVEADAASRRLEAAIADIDASEVSAAEAVRTMQTETHTLMRNVLENSKARVAEMLSLMHQIRTSSDAGPAAETARGPERFALPARRERG